jgi:hypothetical protein
MIDSRAVESDEFAGRGFAFRLATQLAPLMTPVL